jgi:hypothetical protein|tara:strand:+ start:359 stop:868 length:510 start_codon:yes stop_codon:yes gene_type:complete
MIILSNNKVIGLRVSEKDFEKTSKFILNNRKQVIKAVPLISTGLFSLLPFPIYRSLFEDIQLSRADNVISSTTQVFNQFETLPDMFNGIVAWCSYMNARKSESYFSSETSDIKKDRIEFNWCHNMGTQTKNFSQIQYNALQDSKFSQLYNIEFNDLGIISMSLTFEKRN